MEKITGMNARIKLLRKELDLTQEEFANKVGLTRSNYSQFEIGKSNILPDAIARIAKAFDVNAEWILTGEGEKYNSTLPNKPLDRGQFGHEVEKIIAENEFLKKQLAEVTTQNTTLLELLGKPSASERAYHLRGRKKISYRNVA